MSSILAFLESLRGLVTINMKSDMAIALFGKVEQTYITNHYYAHSLVTDTDGKTESSEHGSGSASSGVGCPAESGKNSLGAGDCSASGDERPEA